jgi:hypothetical protein
MQGIRPILIDRARRFKVSRRGVCACVRVKLAGAMQGIHPFVVHFFALMHHRYLCERMKMSPSEIAGDAMIVSPPREFCLRELPLSDDGAYPPGQLGLGHDRAGIGHVKVDEDIAAAWLDVRHRGVRGSSCRAPCLVSRH